MRAIDSWQHQSLGILTAYPGPSSSQLPLRLDKTRTCTSQQRTQQRYAYRTEDLHQGADIHSIHDSTLLPRTDIPARPPPEEQTMASRALPLQASTSSANLRNRRPDMPSGKRKRGKFEAHAKWYQNYWHWGVLLSCPVSSASLVLDCSVLRIRYFGTCPRQRNIDTLGHTLG